MRSNTAPVPPCAQPSHAMLHPSIPPCAASSRQPLSVPDARAIYGRQYNPLMTLQALSYFDDVPAPLSRSVTADLRAAVTAVSLETLPAVTASRRIGEGVGGAGG